MQQLYVNITTPYSYCPRINLYKRSGLHLAEHDRLTGFLFRFAVQANQNLTYGRNIMSSTTLSSLQSQPRKNLSTSSTTEKGDNVIKGTKRSSSWDIPEQEEKCSPDTYQEVQAPIYSGAAPLGVGGQCKIVGRTLGVGILEVVLEHVLMVHVGGFVEVLSENSWWSLCWRYYPILTRDCSRWICYLLKVLARWNDIYLKSSLSLGEKPPSSLMADWMNECDLTRSESI